MSFLWLWQQGGWDVDAWKRAHPWEPVHSEQSDHRELFPVTGGGGEPPAPERWAAAAAKWRAVSDRLLGELNDRPPAKVRWEFLADPMELGGGRPVTMRRLRFTLTDHEWGYAWLLAPRDGRVGPRPAVVALHQTTIQGKNEPVGLDGRPGDPAGMAYGLELAREGFAVLAPDAIGFGERAAEHVNARYRSADQFFAANPNGSVMGKMAFDVSRAIDLLGQMPAEVDAARVGCVGHSHGGYGTIFAAVADPRVRAAAVSCGFTTLRTDPTPQRWWRNTALMPRLAYYEGHVEQVPIDFHLWLALIAPRPLFVSAGLNDAIFPKTDNLPRVRQMLGELWSALGAREAIRWHLYPGPHDFPAAARRGAAAFFHDALGA